MSDRNTLMKAIFQNDAKAILAARRLGANVNEADEDGYTPLHEAIIRGRFLASVALIMTADKNKKSYDGVTPLLAAARNAKNVNDDPIVRALLGAGAKDDIPDFTGERAEDVLEARGHRAYQLLAA